jgi:uncharacterized membrane protein
VAKVPSMDDFQLHIDTSCENMFNYLYKQIRSLGEVMDETLQHLSRIQDATEQLHAGQPKPIQTEILDSIR